MDEVKRTNPLLSFAQQFSQVEQIILTMNDTNNNNNNNNNNSNNKTKNNNNNGEPPSKIFNHGTVTTQFVVGGTNPKVQVSFNSTNDSMDSKYTCTH
jgi:hypothetical protein